MIFHLSRIALAAGLLVAVGCKSTARVYVNYRQVANFHTYSLDPNSSSTTGAGNGMFIMYKVTTINNTGAEAATFTFDRNKVSTVTSDQTSNETVIVSANILLGNQNLETVTVPAGQTMTVNRCFIKQALTSNPAAIQAAQVPIVYAGTGNQPVSTNNVAPNAGVIQIGPALPNPLQNFCQTN